LNKTSADSERLEQKFSKEAWLRYFNGYLLKSGTISQKEYERMVEKIAARCAIHK